MALFYLGHLAGPMFVLMKPIWRAERARLGRACADFKAIFSQWGRNYGEIP